MLIAPTELLEQFETGPRVLQPGVSTLRVDDTPLDQDPTGGECISQLHGTVFLMGRNRTRATRRQNMLMLNGPGSKPPSDLLAAAIDRLWSNAVDLRRIQIAVELFM